MGMKWGADVWPSKRFELILCRSGRESLASLEQVGPLLLPDPRPAERHPQPDMQALHMLLSFNKLLTQRLV